MALTICLAKMIGSRMRRVPTRPGGPLNAETGREKFTLYQWGGPGTQPVVKIDDLRPYTQRP